MTARKLLSTALLLGLLPAGLGVASLALREELGKACLLYAIAALIPYLVRNNTRSNENGAMVLLALNGFCRRFFLVTLLLTLNHLGSCPTWLTGLVISTTLMQWSGFLLIRPGRLNAALMPEISAWNGFGQICVPGIFLFDLLLIQRFPANFRFSEAFHLAGYSFLGALQLLEVAHDFYRVRRPILLWLRALAFQP